MITRDVPDYAEALLPAVAAAIIILIRDFLLTCHEVGARDRVHLPFLHRLNCRCQT